MTPYKFTPYIENELLWKRPHLRKEWCIRVLENPVRSEPQEKNRYRSWGRRAEVITTLSLGSDLSVCAALSALGVSVTSMRSATALHVTISLHGAEISPPA